MTTNSFTGSITTNGEFVTIAELTNFSFTSGKTYTIQIQNIADLKIADAIFTIVNNPIFTLTASDDDVYIKTNGYVTLTILENL